MHTEQCHLAFLFVVSEFQSRPGTLIFLKLESDEGAGESRRLGTGEPLEEGG